MSSEEPTLSAQVNRLSKIDPQTLPDNAASELVTVVDELLVSLSTKFNNLSSELIGKMDEMSRRLDNLEANIEAATVPKEGDKTT